jgi:hypothetical protein
MLSDDRYIIFCLLTSFFAFYLQTIPTFKCPSADYSQFQSDNFGNFLIRLAYALASTFLYGGLKRHNNTADSLSNFAGTF